MKLQCTLAVLATISLTSTVVSENPKPPIKRFTRGFEERVEYISATIEPRHLNTGSGTTLKTRAYAKKMSGIGAINDDAGHLIAQRLGGTGKETYNIVPQNRRINRGTWRIKVENALYGVVSGGDTIVFEVWPRYNNSTSTRPFQLDYQALFTNGTFFFPLAYMANPL